MPQDISPLDQFTVLSNCLSTLPRVDDGDPSGDVVINLRAKIIHRLLMLITSMEVAETMEEIAQSVFNSRTKFTTKEFSDKVLPLGSITSVVAYQDNKDGSVTVRLSDGVHYKIYARTLDLKPTEWLRVKEKVG